MQPIQDQPFLDLPGVTDAAIRTYPERVLQFGTGVLLRGLVDFVLDTANRSGEYDGRVVLVKSTDRGSTQAFDEQEGLFTLCMQGMVDGQAQRQFQLVSSISRVLWASKDWPAIQALARSADLELVVSNTTEVGLQLDESDHLNGQPPSSFPAKLLALLYERYRHFSGAFSAGLVILPTELITNNGQILKQLLLQLAERWGMESAFREWLVQANTFCSTLVDRIVTGRPDATTQANLEAALGYTDQLLIVSEPYLLWAIEAPETPIPALRFAAAHPGVIVAPDINKYRELKLRLLNGSHTLSCGLAWLAGCQTVRSAMEDPTVSSFVEELLMEELIPALPPEIDHQEALTFGSEVLNRFRNPYLEHEWLNITFQYTSKMRMRCFPLLVRYVTQTGQIPQRFVLGLAAYFYFMRVAGQDERGFYGTYGEKRYYFRDDRAAYFHRLQTATALEDMPAIVLADQELWGQDHSRWEGLVEKVTEYLDQIQQQGLRPIIAALINEPSS